MDDTLTNYVFAVLLVAAFVLGVVYARRLGRAVLVIFLAAGTGLEVISFLSYWFFPPVSGHPWGPIHVMRRLTLAFSGDQAIIEGFSVIVFSLTGLGRFFIADLWDRVRRFCCPKKRNGQDKYCGASSI